MYMCVVCFFFFKQKTAYEMRISDWSSDVCSSDLLRRHPRLQVSLGSTDRTIDLIREGVDCVVRVGALRDSSLVARPLGHVALEIGRASCRERVCQYV